ncbi:MAG: patatin-like phospholipase family protein [Trueperaceae bacterium]|nr:patatin-like phospholipase family protein [Trueperaceae bacterium]
MPYDTDYDADTSLTRTPPSARPPLQISLQKTVDTETVNAVRAAAERRSDLRIGLALGGGSARGYAHIGVLASLERHGLAPDIVVGTSFGALVGALYASGQDADELAEFATAQRTRDLLPQLMDFGLHKAALFSGDKLESYLDRLMEGRHFADLPREFAVVATDVDSGERVVLQEGSLARALRASATLPGIFAPVDIGGRRLVDGGLGSPVPVTTLADFDVDLSLGIGVGMQGSESAPIRLALRCLETDWGRQLYQGLRDSEGGHPLQVLGRAFAHTVNSWRGQEVPVGTHHIQATPPISWLNFHKADLAIRAGDDALEAYASTLRRDVAALVG